MEKVTKSQAGPIVRKNYERLKQIKNIVQKGEIRNLKSVKIEAKGSASLYVALMELDILKKVDGKYSWNSKIPISYTLATTVTAKTKSLIDIRRAKYPKNTNVESTPNDSNWFRRILGAFKRS